MVEEKKIDKLDPIIEKFMREEHPELYPIPASALGNLIGGFITIAVGSIVLAELSKSMKESGVI